MTSTKLGWGLVVCLLTASVTGVACTAGGEAPHGSGSGGAGVGGTGSNMTSGGGEISFTTSGSGTGTPTDGGKPAVCDDAGHCSCITIASLGKPAHYGSDNDNTDAFQTWLNTKSSAKVDLVTTRTPLTPEFLANYDVLILQALEDAESGPFWHYEQSELDALANWVKSGGGLITLTGYGGDAGEVDPDNQLLAFTGISYNKDDILGQCPGGVPCYCWGNSVPMGGFQASHPISANITQIAAFHGRSINSTDATLVAGEGGVQYGVAKQVGKGKVFVFSDEWVTYSSQWLGKPQQPPNPNDPCYDNAKGVWKTADKVFQVPQFWYNVIKWAAPDTDCDFDIDDPGVIK
ncbi:hypothetical protein A7982_12996 [Minicystis rosea]|nr:hypothetical protein A7982_12996 [Minicystis rosea]